MVAVLVVAAAVWVLVFSPVLDVTEVRVAGAAPETTSAVREAVEVPEGRSLLWLDTAAVADRVRTLPRVATVDVRRSLPGTLVVTVSEREPVLAVTGPNGVVLVDRTGFAYRTIPKLPAGVPLLALPAATAPSPEDPATATAVRVLSTLPDDLRRRIAQVRAGGPFDVGFLLTDGRGVRWGADAENDRKAAVLGPLLTRPGQTYDVSTPELAVVS